MSNVLLDTALSYAARGWYVFPLHTPQSNGFCSCSQPSACKNVGKHPRSHATLLPHGKNSASTDSVLIRTWWQLWPDANIGITTGTLSGIWALDIDPRHGGDANLHALLTQHGPLPDTPEVCTGGGGIHYIFRHPGHPIRTKTEFAPGLDSLGDGGSIVAAPSLHASGARYTWQVSPDDIAPADAPNWLLQFVLQPVTPPPSSSQPTANGTHGPLPKRTLHYLVFGASPGTRNSELFFAAQQFYANGYTLQEAFDKLKPRAQTDGLPDHEIDRTIHSAYQSNQVNQPTGANPTPVSPVSNPQNPSRRSSAMIAAALQSFGYTFRLNLCGNIVEVNDTPITDFVEARIRTDARDAGLKPLDAVMDTVLVEADKHSYHPVKDYLASLTWDGIPRIAHLSDLLHGDDPPVVYSDGTQRPLIAVYLRRWMIGAVAKVFVGAQNLMLVLAGDQNLGKSHFAEWLCSGLPDYFIEEPINVADKDTSIRLMMKFIWSVSELDATTRKQDVAALKDFITKKIVTVRKAYGRHDIVGPAMASLIGSINPSTGYLADDTGNRRYLTATISRIDWSYTQLDIHQLWAEAVDAFHQGETWKLVGPEAELQERQNKLHEVESITEGWITSYFEFPVPGHRMTASEIVDHLRTRYDIRLTGTERSQAQELARVMGRLGIRKGRTSTWRGYFDIKPKYP